MRHVVVTGGGTGIGLAVAAWFAEAGEQVTITGRRKDVLEAAATRIGATAIAFDAADPRAVAAALPALPPRVDVLVNNAGGNTDLDTSGAEPGDLTAVAAAWRANFDANVLAAVLLTTALTPRLADHARIVLFSSIAARSTGSGSYGAAKAALESWTGDLAAELGPRGITVNAIAPGLVLETEFFRGRLSEDGIRRRAASTRNGRAGTPADIVAAVRYLTSPDAGHLTGQVMHVDGGAYLGR